MGPVPAWIRQERIASRSGSVVPLLRWGAGMRAGTCPQMTQMGADGVQGEFGFIRVIREGPGLRGGGDCVRVGWHHPDNKECGSSFPHALPNPPPDSLQRLASSTGPRVFSPRGAFGGQLRPFAGRHVGGAIQLRLRAAFAGIRVRSFALDKSFHHGDQAGVPLRGEFRKRSPLGGLVQFVGK